jgi:hypothetical protein
MSLVVAAALLTLAGGPSSCPASLETRALPPPPNRPAPDPPQPDPRGLDYRHRIYPTVFGWPRLDHWCVWVEPVLNDGVAARWDQAWLSAVEGALATWEAVLPITRVSSPDQAQVRLYRRRPPLRNGRASHGRAELELQLVRRHPAAGSVVGPPQPEPLVSVSISPAQRVEAMEATALHELGHAFGLWGHSDQPNDAMAAVPGARPIRQLSARDRATLIWLQQQPGLLLSPEEPSGGLPEPAGPRDTPAAERSPRMDRRGG